ncbi:hypothetical protein L596_030007 [Steinernema carpocapsae]|uniref:Uncharacterized protein n=1 Tax=Steinernema carpocapsae TaxID=34508 RepID=A0A4U5LRG3_STECR|nr:hypothetical protein L596_030007 [Steinernema carpocapsae]
MPLSSPLPTHINKSPANTRALSEVTPAEPGWRLALRAASRRRRRRGSERAIPNCFFSPPLAIDDSS